jgi:hypothetical protein
VSEPLGAVPSGSEEGTSHVPLGPGLVIRRLRLAEGDVVRLRGILAGYDGLASAHGDRSGVTVLVTTDDRAAELDAWLAELDAELSFERLA